MIPTRPLGRTGVEVTLFGLGGEGVLRTLGREAAARSVIEQAMEAGVTYFDCAKAYAGSESYYGLVYEKLPKARRAQLFQASKSAQRDRRSALRELDHTLSTMKLDYLDLWQMHDLRTSEDIEQLTAPGGALEAVEEAKQAGKIRFVGATGHQDPDILTRAIESYPFDTVLLPVNPLEPHHRSFLTSTLPVAVQRGMGIIGMKVPCRGYLLTQGPRVSMRMAMRYALSQPVSTVIIGCDTPAQVTENAAIAREFTPMPEAEQAEIVAQTRPYLEMMFYKPLGIA
ncbi:MAG: aldo/keto reductase [Candidatus Xenobia bacterium]